MSAREMMTFIFYFPLIFGDMVPYDDMVWKFLINFFEILDILLCFEITETDISLLSKKIEKHNSDYILLFKDTLKPKFHNLSHYATIIRYSGPLRNLWCFKYAYQLTKSYDHVALYAKEKHKIKSAYYTIIQIKTRKIQSSKKGKEGNIKKSGKRK